MDNKSPLLKSDEPMTKKIYDILGVGSAITDIVCRVSRQFLEKHNLIPGSMTLIDDQQVEKLHKTLKPEEIVGGGSAANTCVIAAQFGSRTAFLGKVRRDETGDKFSQDLQENDVDFPAEPLNTHVFGNRPSARCYVMVTPDGQRTMATYLGASSCLAPDDIFPDIVAMSRLIYLEGYLFDPPTAQEAFRHATSLAHANDCRVALSLSDPFCVGRHREAFKQLVDHHIDIVFANKDEICALYETANFNKAAHEIGQHTSLCALTKGEEGSVIISDGEMLEIPAVPTQVVDTTGAGDAYAAGFLSGLTSSRSLKECGRLAAVAAAEVISHYGGRPLTSLWEEMGF